MIRVNFCRAGASVSDWEITTKVEFLKEMAPKSWEQEMVYDFSNMLLFDALRAEIAEGNLSLDNIQFSYEDEPIRVNHYGACNEDYPKQGELNLNYSTRVLIAAMNKRKQESEDRLMEKYGVKTLRELKDKRDKEKEGSNLAKAIEEGQAPGPAGDSTTSGNQ